MKSSRYAVFATMALLSSSATAYDPATHAKISEAAYTASELDKSPVLGARLGINVEKAMFPSSRQESKNALELIQFGARFEDDRQAIQALYHFYDPANAGRGLTLRSRTGSLTTPGMSSPDWALEDRGDAIDLLGQRNPFSYKQSRQYFFDALTDLSRS